MGGHGGVPLFLPLPRKTVPRGQHPGSGGVGAPLCLPRRWPMAGASGQGARSWGALSAQGAQSPLGGPQWPQGLMSPWPVPTRDGAEGSLGPGRLCPLPCPCPCITGGPGVSGAAPCPGAPVCPPPQPPPAANGAVGTF